jgi:hypothetical protein
MPRAATLTPAQRLLALLLANNDNEFTVTAANLLAGYDDGYWLRRLAGVVVDGDLSHLVGPSPDGYDLRWEELAELAHTAVDLLFPDEVARPGEHRKVLEMACSLARHDAKISLRNVLAHGPDPKVLRDALNALILMQEGYSRAAVTALHQGSNR